jgi:transposase
MEQLDQLQHDIISAFNPNRFGIPGILGYHSDYVYSFFIQNKDTNTVQTWTRSIKKKLSDAFELTNGMHVKTGIKVGFVNVDSEYKDSYQVLSNAKSALSQALKSDKNEAI